MARILKYGMVGGGPGAFIGEAHRRALALDGNAQLVAGSFSRSFEKTLQQGELLHLDRERLYKDFTEMAREEGKRGELDFIVIVTTNTSHYAACKAFLEAGIPVVCEKPLTVELSEALELKRISEEKGLPFMVTYTYGGHLTAKYARELIRSGEIGKVRMVQGEYPQGWLAQPDVSGNKQAEWRVDPAAAGKTNALGDLGTHIENTVSMMTGLKIKRLLAKMDRQVPGRKLDDNSMVLLEFENGASGAYWASQIAMGHDNSLRIRIYGTKGSILWFQERPEEITVVREDGTVVIKHRGHAGIPERADRYRRLPSGHPEGYHEALANLYGNFMECLLAVRENRLEPSMIDFPTVDDGIDGVRFIDACLRSNEDGSEWVSLNYGQEDRK